MATAIDLLNDSSVDNAPVPVKENRGTPGPINVIRAVVDNGPATVAALDMEIQKLQEKLNGLREERDVVAELVATAQAYFDSK